MTTIPVRANNRIWTTYRHFPYKHWYAIAELVDNPTQSYLDHRAELDPILAEDGETFQVRIDYDRRGRRLSIADNAFGMDLVDLRRALELAYPPPDTSGRSEFGNGHEDRFVLVG